MSTDQWSLTVLRSPDGRRADVAVLSDRQLAAAALTALLTEGDRRKPAVKVRGNDEARAALAAGGVAAVVVEGVTSTWQHVTDVLEPAVRILLLVDPEADTATLGQAASSNADGFLSHSSSPEALEAAIASVLTAHQFIDPVLAAPLLQAKAAARRPVPTVLSARETDILTRIAAGQSSKQIAREYGLTPKTVCNHVSNIYAKLHLRHRGQLVLYAARVGLAPLLEPSWQVIARGA